MRLCVQRPIISMSFLVCLEPCFVVKCLGLIMSVLHPRACKRPHLAHIREELVAGPSRKTELLSQDLHANLRTHFQSS
jgi:hypothetical protein